MDRKLYFCIFKDSHHEYLINVNYKTIRRTNKKQRSVIVVVTHLFSVLLLTLWSAEWDEIDMIDAPVSDKQAHSYNTER